jgi:hypothetical protein
MVAVSDSDPEHWLADDEDFIATLGDLDRGLTGDGKSSPPAPPPTSPETAADRTASGVIKAARAINPPLSPRDEPRQPPPLRPGGEPSPLLARFPRPAEADPHTPRRLVNLFPESALEPVQQPPDVPADSGSPPPDRSSRDEVAQRLLTAIRSRGGPVLLIAPVGWGKTTLCRALPRELDRRTVVSLVSDPPQSTDDLLRTMLIDFGVMAPGERGAALTVARPVLTRALETFLQSLEQLHAAALVVVDDAHTVPVEVLVDLAATLAPGRPGASVLQLVLAGEPALGVLLKHPALRDFDASIRHRIEVGEPIAAREPDGHVHDAMPAASVAPAGSATASLDEDVLALDELFDTPLAPNLFRDVPAESGRRPPTIFEAPALDVEAGAGLDEPADRPRVARRLVFVAAFALLALAGAGGALWVWRDAVSRTILQWEGVPVPPAAPAAPLPAPIAPVEPPAAIPRQG